MTSMNNIKQITEIVNEVIDNEHSEFIVNDNEVVDIQYYLNEAGLSLKVKTSYEYINNARAVVITLVDTINTGNGYSYKIKEVVTIQTMCKIIRWLQLVQDAYSFNECFYKSILNYCDCYFSAVEVNKYLKITKGIEVYNSIITEASNAMSNKCKDMFKLKNNRINKY